MKNIFKKEVTENLCKRIDKLTPETRAIWGKMNVSQMLAHCNVTYEMIYENKHTKPSTFKQFLIKLFVKNLVVSEKPFKKNIRTAPEFVITESKDFEHEKKRLIEYLQKTQQLGEVHFDNKASLSLGKLTKTEWNNMMYKHLNHHLTQFGV